MNIGIVVSEFNREITSEMEREAERAIKKLRHKVAGKFYVYGALDSPIAVQYLLKKKNVDGVVVLGAVVSGATDHDKVVVDVAVQGVTELMLKYNKPIGWGISGPRQTWKQANQRAKEYARRAVEAVIKIHSQMK